MAQVVDDGEAEERVRERCGQRDPDDVDWRGRDCCEVLLEVYGAAERDEREGQGEE